MRGGYGGDRDEWWRSRTVCGGIPRSGKCSVTGANAGAIQPGSGAQLTVSAGGAAAGGGSGGAAMPATFAASATRFSISARMSESAGSSPASFMTVDGTFGVTGLGIAQCHIVARHLAVGLVRQRVGESLAGFGRNDALRRQYQQFAIGLVEFRLLLRHHRNQGGGRRWRPCPSGAAQTWCAPAIASR